MLRPCSLTKEFEKEFDMHIVKSVGVLSIAKIMALVEGCMGLIFAPFFLLIGLLGSIAGQHQAPFAGIFGIFFALLMPILYAILGFITGAIGGLLYTFFAKLVGGFELELELQPQSPIAPYPIIPPTTTPSVT
jgi:hypothetical protein